MTFHANAPPLLVDDLDRYPPESNYEEDQPRKYSCDEAFHNPYRWYGLIRRWIHFLAEY